jgi:hypothetical protein
VIGHPALKDHIAGLTFLAKTHRENEWGTFYDAVNRAAPQFGKTMLLPFHQEVQVSDSLDFGDSVELELLTEGVERRVLEAGAEPEVLESDQ